MRFAKIKNLEISNGSGIGVSLYVQGCNIRCKGCFNPETWDFTQGKDFSCVERAYLLTLLENPYVFRFSILGGEPMDEAHREEVIALARTVKEMKPKMKIWLYSGYELDVLKNKGVLDKDSPFDFIVYGPFIEELKDLDLSFRGSSNQVILDVKKYREELEAA